MEGVENIAGGVYEVYKNGFTGIALIKFKQVGIGALQIALEPIPGLDAQADMVQASLEQLGHNLELARSVGQIKQAIRGLDAGETRVNPYLFRYPGYTFKYPAGLEMEPMKNAPQHSYGVPLGTLKITAPVALDHQVPLMIVGELPIPAGNPAAAIARQLGGQERGGTVYLPAEVGYLAESDASNGDIILDGYTRYRTTDSVSRVVSWDINCRRGKQNLKVRLRSGETTSPVVVDNDFMNKIDQLSVTPLSGGKITLSPDESATGLRVIGTGTQLEQRFWPDLTSRNKCLDMAIPDADVAALTRGDTLTVSAVGPGETALNLLLAGSSPGGGVGELETSVPIVVGAPGILFDDSWTQKFYNDWWQASLSLQISSSKQGLTLLEDNTFGAMRNLVFQGKEGSYIIDVGLTGVKPLQDSVSTVGLKVFGQFDDGVKSESSNFSTEVKFPNDNGHGTVQLSFNVLVYRETDSGGLNWVASDAVIYIVIMQ